MPNQSQSSFSFSRVESLTARVIASGLGSGRTPGLPGTAGSAALCGIWYYLIPTSAWASTGFSLIVVLVVSIIGTAATHVALRETTDTDPGWIVIDEWAGMLVALMPLHERSLLLCFVAFVLFRFFDILKPWPISRAEKLPGAFGVMLDDLVAGVFAALCLYPLLLVFS